MSENDWIYIELRTFEQAPTLDVDCDEEYIYSLTHYPLHECQLTKVQLSNGLVHWQTKLRTRDKNNSDPCLLTTKNHLLLLDSDYDIYLIDKKDGRTIRHDIFGGYMKLLKTPNHIFVVSVGDIKRLEIIDNKVAYQTWIYDYRAFDIEYYATPFYWNERVHIFSIVGIYALKMEPGLETPFRVSYSPHGDAKAEIVTRNHPDQLTFLSLSRNYVYLASNNGMIHRLNKEYQTDLIINTTLTFWTRRGRSFFHDIGPSKVTPISDYLLANGPTGKFMMNMSGTPLFNLSNKIDNWPIAVIHKNFYVFLSMEKANWKVSLCYINRIWSTSGHRGFGKLDKERIKTLFLLRNQPECNWKSLPREIVYLIAQSLVFANGLIEGTKINTYSSY